MAGLAALFAIAEPETTMVPFAGPTVRLRYSAPLEQLRNPPRHADWPPDESLRAPSRLAALLGSLRNDQMLRNSLYLMLNMGVQAALGFGFWIIAARYFTTESIGQGSSLISASSLISFAGMLGLNTALLKFLPTTRQRNRLITAGLAIVTVCSGLIAAFYVLLLPIFSKPLSFVTHSLPLALGFVILTAGAGINLLTDSIFIGTGRSKYTALVDGVVGGVAKIFLIVVLAGTGAYGVFGAAGGGFLAAALGSIWLIYRVIGWRPVFDGLGQALKPVLSFSGMNYAGNLVNVLPTLVVPLIIINKVGSSAAAYYFVSYQLAALLYSTAYSVENAFMAEGAHSGVVNRAILWRSGRLLIALCVPSFIAVLLFGHLMLSAFGASYGAHAVSSLLPLTAAVLPIGVYYWSLTVLRLSDKLRAIVWSNVAYSAGIIGFALVLAPRGLAGISMAWPLGTTVGALVAGGAAINSLRRAS